MSDDSDYEDAREEGILNDDSPPRPPAPAPDAPPAEEEPQHGQEQQLPPVNNNQQQGDHQGLNAHDIVRQVIDNLWPMLGGNPHHPHQPAPLDDEDVDHDGMENVEDGYFDEEENGKLMDYDDDDDEDDELERILSLACDEDYILDR